MSEGGLQVLLDRLAVQDLLTRYALAVDTLDLDLLDDVFTAGARIDYTSSGGVTGPYAEVREWLAGVLPIFAMRQHLVANVTVHFGADGDSARSSAYFYNPMGWLDAEGTMQVFQVGGYYHDTLARTPGGWRITERREEQAWRIGRLPG